MVAVLLLSLPAPVGPYRLLAADVPHVELEAIMHKRLDVEALRARVRACVRACVRRAGGRACAQQLQVLLMASV